MAHEHFHSLALLLKSLFHLLNHSVPNLVKKPYGGGKFLAKRIKDITASLSTIRSLLQLVCDSRYGSDRSETKKE